MTLPSPEGRRNPAVLSDVRSRAGRVALKSKIATRGLVALDRRTASARALLAWRLQLIDALGGAEQISPQQVTLVELVCRLKVFLDDADAFLLNMPTIVIKRKRKLLPLVKERTLLAAELRATLALLGLKKIPKLVSSIEPERMEKILAVEAEQQEQENARAASEEEEPVNV